MNNMKKTAIITAFSLAALVMTTAAPVALAQDGSTYQDRVEERRALFEENSQERQTNREEISTQVGENVDVVLAGEDRVDLTLLMDELAQRGIRSLLLEGGSTLNFSMLQEGFVDEVRVCVAPMIAGGVKSKTLVDGEGVAYMKDAYKLKLKKNYKLGKDFILEYEVLK